MSEKNFRVTKHIIPGQHIREYPNSTASSEDILQLEFKQYVPLDNLHPKFGDITIIATHANAFAKELYEPLWDDLLDLSRSTTVGFRIRGIWIADMAHQGASGILNEHILGPDSHWFDHSRDLLRTVDTFRAEMPLPIIGIGHSVGGPQLVGLAQMHPRLISNMIIIEPPIFRFPARTYFALAKTTALQQDLWSSREEAEMSVMENPLLKDWDPRVMEIHKKMLFRDTPTVVYPNAPPGSVTKTTTRTSEFVTVHRPNLRKISMRGRPATVEERRTHPDVDPQSPIQYPFYIGAQTLSFNLLPTLRPAALFIHGEKSPNSVPAMRKERLETCGIGPGGSGGAKTGRVKEALLPGGHFLPFDMVAETAKVIADYLGPEMRDWKEVEGERLRNWHALSVKERQTIGDDVLEVVRNYDPETKKRLKSLHSKL